MFNAIAFTNTRIDRMCNRLILGGLWSIILGYIGKNVITPTFEATNINGREDVDRLYRDFSRGVKYKEAYKKEHGHDVK